MKGLSRGSRMGALIMAVKEESSADKKEENSKDVGEKGVTVGGLG